MTFWSTITSCLTAASPVAYWSWRLTRNRKIVLIRRKLVRLGIEEPESVSEWLKLWRTDPDSNLSKKAANILDNEKSRADLEGALDALLPNTDVDETNSLSGRFTKIVKLVVHVFMPYSLGATEREMLDRYGDIVLAELDRANPSRRRGEVLDTGKIRVRLQRFIKMADYGEIWLAVSAEWSSQHVKGAALEHNRWIVHVLTKHQSIDHDRFETLRSDLRRLSNIDGIMFTDAGRLKTEAVPFIVTEYVEGGSLKEWIKASDDQRPKLDKGQVMDCVINAVAEAHRLGLHHRRLTPSRVYLPETTTGGVKAKVADFWMSAVMDDEGENVYTPFDARPSRGNRSEGKYDVFSLGVTWYQFMIDDTDFARPPYDFYERLNEDGKAARKWIKRCLAHVDARFNDAIELQEAMNSAIPGEPEITEAPPLDLDLPPDWIDVSSLVEDYLATAG